MLGRRGHFPEEKLLTAVVITSKTRGWQRAVAALRLMPMTTRGHIPLFLACLITHTARLCHVCVRPPGGSWLCPEGAGLGLSPSGSRTRRAWTRHPMSKLGRIQFMDRFSLNAHCSSQQHSRRGLRRPLALKWTGAPAFKVRGIRLSADQSRPSRVGSP